MSGDPGLVGYMGICTEEGVFVLHKDAPAYAMERIRGEAALFRAFSRMKMEEWEAEEWFYSGDFVKVYKEETQWIRKSEQRL